MFEKRWRQRGPSSSSNAERGVAYGERGAKSPNLRSVLGYGERKACSPAQGSKSGQNWGRLAKRANVSARGVRTPLPLTCLVTYLLARGPGVIRVLQTAAQGAIPPGQPFPPPPSASSVGVGKGIAIAHRGS